MASATRYYGLGFFDFSDALGTDFAGQTEIDRFVFIDKQLFGMMSIFGNGVISGWEVTASETFSISISQGIGNLNFTSGRTDFPSEITGLSPNAIYYVYAKVVESIPYNENVAFFLSPSVQVSDPRFLLLAKVVTGPLSIETIDNSIRQEIEFLTLIKAAIQRHKHRGGSLNPSKIDLASEVKGQLPSFRIADFDAEKITTGTFDLGRMPLLDHQELKNVGLLTHPQLDTFVKTLEISNKEIFGEIGTANLLQLILAAKFIYDDPESALYLADRLVDEFMINEFVVIPGITTNDFIDFENSSAEIDLEQHFIKGIPPVTGTSFYITYDTALAWQSAHTLENVTVIGDSVALSFNDADDINLQTIEGFESATEADQILDDSGTGSGGLFARQTVILDDNAHIKANASATNVIEGFFSGKFAHRQTFRTQFVKKFQQPQDWSTFDTFVLHIKCIDSIHGPVKLYFTNTAGEKSVEYIILDQDEITENPDPNSNDFEIRSVDLTTLPFANNIKTFVIYTDDLENPFSFIIDFINIQRAVLLPEEGRLVLRASLGTQVTFAHIEFSKIEFPGTVIEVRARSASGTAFLVRQEFTGKLGSTDIINLRGSDIEIEVIFRPDPERLISPVLQLLRILVLAEAEIDGFVINTSSEFSRGKAENIVITDTDTLSLETPIYVNSYYFALGNTVNQVHQNISGDVPFVEAELGLFGNNSPLSPNLVYKTIEDDLPNITLARFFEPRSVRRAFDRSFVIADTYNDRVLRFDEDGNLEQGVGSVNYEASKLFPVSAAVDLRTNILYIVWSRPINFTIVNVSKINLQTSTQKIQLIKDFDKILGLTTSELEQNQPPASKILPIHLSPQNGGLVQRLSATDGFMFAASDALTTGIETDSEIFARINTPLGIPLFVGNFAYIDGIFSPTFADVTDDGGFIIANGTLGVKDFTFPDGFEESVTRSVNVSSIVEVDKNNNLVFGTNVAKFSPWIPGRVEKLDNNTFLIGGLRSDSTENAVEGFNFRFFFGTDEEREAQRLVLQELFFGTDDTPTSFGVVLIYDRKANAKTFEYTSAEGVLVSDVDVDVNTGQFVIAESSFNKSGRIIKLDGTGNIVFSFGEGLYRLINSVKTDIDGSMVVST